MNKHLILLETKKEYTKQLKSVLVNPLYDGIDSIYNDSKNIYKENEKEYIKKDYGILTVFQILLSKVHKWNVNVVEEETKRIKLRANCDYLENLIEAIIKSQVNIMLYTGKNNKTSFKIEIPDTTLFIHQCYIEIARNFYKKPYLIIDININDLEKQKNMSKCCKLIQTSIDDCITKILPIKNILKHYLGDSYINSDENIKQTITDSHRKNTKKLLKKTITESQIESLYSNNSSSKNNNSIIVEKYTNE